MILAVCLNPALDVTYRLATALSPHASHRVTRVRWRPGGKGLNVARVLHRLGEPVGVLAPVGGTTGAEIRAGLLALGIEPGSGLVDIPAPTRQTVTVVDAQGATVFNEPGPVWDRTTWERVVEEFGRRLTTAQLAVLAGSLPPTAPPDAYGQLTERARALGVPVVVDAEGESLRSALPARPYLVKPNVAELATVVASPLVAKGDIVAAGSRLLELGARNAVISCGADGVVAVTPDGCWRAVVRPRTGNPTGAGDALVAALAVGAVRGDAWPRRLRDGVALAVAAVVSPVAGEFDPTVVAAAEPDVHVEELTERSCG